MFRKLLVAMIPVRESTRTIAHDTQPTPVTTRAGNVQGSSPNFVKPPPFWCGITKCDLDLGLDLNLDTGLDLELDNITLRLKIE